MVRRIGNYPYGKGVDLDYLEKIRYTTPVKDRDDTHQTIPHIKPIKRFIESIESAKNIDVKKIEITVSNDNSMAHCRAIWDFVSDDPTVPHIEGSRFGASVINDHQKRWALGVDSEMEDEVCTNKMTVSTNLSQCRRKHTKGILDSWQEIIDEGVRGAFESVHQLKNLVDSYKNVSLDCRVNADERRIDHVLGNMVRGRILNASGAAAVDKLWRNPLHPEHLPRNLDRFRQAVTEFDKGKNPFTRRVRNNGLVNMLADEFGTPHFRDEHLKKIVDQREKFNHTDKLQENISMYDF